MNNGTPPLGVFAQPATDWSRIVLDKAFYCPEIKRLDQFIRFEKDDPNELLKNRFLCRGGSLGFYGQTGIGKSSLIMQMAILWSIGNPCFGITPSGPLKILMVQAENDDGDLAEMRDGILNGLGIIETWNSENIFIATDNCNSGDMFIQSLTELVNKNKPDLIIIDPLFAYIGGSVSDQAVMSNFLRNQLNPLLHASKCGCIIVHHTNKPPSGKEKSGWEGPDFAYAGSGSAELSNWARGVIYLRSIGSTWMFELMLAKRGGRVGWSDLTGTKILSKPICHNQANSNIFWTEPSREQLASSVTIRDGKQRPKPSVQEFLSLFPDLIGGNPQSSLLTAEQIKNKFIERKWDKDTYKGLCDEAESEGMLGCIKGKKANQILRGKVAVIEAYRSHKNEENTLLSETPSLPLNKPKKQKTKRAK